MNAYEGLVTRTLQLITGDYGRDPLAVAKARQILAEVLRTLEGVTPEMRADDWMALKGKTMAEAYLAMLHASPLAPPK